MRYSRGRIILTTIISISCFALVVFVIYKGIGYAKKVNGVEEPKVVKANVTEKKKIVKKVETKKTTKKDEKEKKTTKKAEKKTKKEQVVVKKEEVKKETKPVTTEPVQKQEIKKEEVKEVPTFDNGIVGKYVIKELTIDGKEYTKKEIDKLIKEGYSMNLEIDSSGLATIHVLSINHFYAVDDTYFDDGKNKIVYSHSNTRIRITVDNAKMLFIKK